MNTATLDDIKINSLFEDIEDIRTKKAHTRSKHIKVRSSVEKAKDDYKEARHIHNKAIWLAWLDYRGKEHKILKHQAHNMYRLVKLADKK
jgi:hypothetical protein